MDDVLLGFKSQVQTYICECGVVDTDAELLVELRAISPKREVVLISFGSSKDDEVDTNENERESLP